MPQPPPSGIVSAGTSAHRPKLGPAQVSVYYDQTLGKLIYWSGPHWYDMTGAQVADYGSASGGTSGLHASIFAFGLLGAATN